MEIDARTRLCLLFGNPVTHSLSPVIHNAAFRELGLNIVYLACAVETPLVGAAVESLRALAVVGANVTSPYKEAVLPYIDSISERSQQIQAVNTIVNRNGQLFATSTDGTGFFHYISSDIAGYDPGGQPVMVVGSGGAARAIAYELAQRGADQIYVVNRSSDKGIAFADMLLSATPIRKASFISLYDKQLSALLRQVKLIIYTLPVDCPEIITAINQNNVGSTEQLLVDLRYGNQETAVMSAFRKKGGSAFDGLGMLFWQAVQAFELFTEKEAPISVMRQAIKYS